MKHTKGPWTIEEIPYKSGLNGVGIVDVFGPKGTVCCCEESDYEETKANACLIAAAPEMLQALIRIEKLSTIDSEFFQKITVIVGPIILKARGMK